MSKIGIFRRFGAGGVVASIGHRTAPGCTRLWRHFEHNAIVRDAAARSDSKEIPVPIHNEWIDWIDAVAPCIRESVEHSFAPGPVRTRRQLENRSEMLPPSLVVP